MKRILRKRVLNNPAFRQHGKYVQFIAFGDFNLSTGEVLDVVDKILSDITTIHQSAEKGTGRDVIQDMAKTARKGSVPEQEQGEMSNLALTDLIFEAFWPIYHYVRANEQI